ncbi:2285_t:CDS:2, partial [Racocetra fulgida]
MFIEHPDYTRKWGITGILKGIQSLLCLFTLNVLTRTGYPIHGGISADVEGRTKKNERKQMNGDRDKLKEHQKTQPRAKGAVPAVPATHTPKLVNSCKVRLRRYLEEEGIKG